MDFDLLDNHIDISNEQLGSIDISAMLVAIGLLEMINLIDIKYYLKVDAMNFGSKNGELNFSRFAKSIKKWKDGMSLRIINKEGNLPMEFHLLLDVDLYFRNIVKDTDGGFSIRDIDPHFAIAKVYHDSTNFTK